MLNFLGYTPICGVPLIWDSPKWQNLTRLVTYRHIGGVGGANNLSNLNIYWVRVPHKKPGQKLVLSDALAVQSQGLLDLKGYQGRKVSSLKVITRSKKVHNLKEMIDIVEIV